MARLIRWQRKAEKQLDEILHFWTANYSRQAAAKLYPAIERKLDALIRYPEAGRCLSAQPGVRCVQIKNSHYLFYGYDDHTLFVVAIHGSKSPEIPFF